MYYLIYVRNEKLLENFVWYCLRGKKNLMKMFLVYNYIISLLGILYKRRQGPKYVPCYLLWWGKEQGAGKNTWNSQYWGNWWCELGSSPNGLLGIFLEWWVLLTKRKDVMPELYITAIRIILSLPFLSFFPLVLVCYENVKCLCLKLTFRNFSSLGMDSFSPIPEGCLVPAYKWWIGFGKPSGCSRFKLWQ